jgi:ribonuclease E
LWNKIREATLVSNAPAFIHMEEGIIQKIIRDVFDNDVKEMIVEGDEAFLMAQKFMKNIMPTEVHKIKKYKNTRPIFTQYKIEEQISALYKPQVNLPSGGYIIINPTEALTAIDVNSGKSIMERNIESTALKNNLEAAREIARQLRIRNISGLIVIDFIDMYETKHRRIVEKSFREFIERDKSKIQAYNISPLGLMEVSRQRLKPSFLESHSKICDHCHGKGLVRADESNSMVILRTIESEIVGSKSNLFNVFVHAEIQSYISNYKRKEIIKIESKHSVKINFFISHNSTADSFYIEKMNKIQDVEIDLPETTIARIQSIEEKNSIEPSLKKKPRSKNFVPKNPEIKAIENNKIDTQDKQEVKDVEEVQEVKDVQDSKAVKFKKFRRKKVARKNNVIENPVLSKD